MTRWVGWLSVLLIASWGALALSCRSTEPSKPVAIRLVDRFEDSMVEGGRAPATGLARTEWRFDGSLPPPPGAAPGAVAAWQVGFGVTDLRVAGGRLSGRSTDDLAIVYAGRQPDALGGDILHAVEIRLRATAGNNLYVHFEAGEDPTMPLVVEQSRVYPWMIGSPLLADGEMRTYTLLPRPPEVYDAASIRHVLVRPTDRAGADFEIESVRLIFRREHLASIPTSIAWQGLSEVFRESVVAHVPETVRLTARLPERPWLDLAVGTLDVKPVTFRVTAAPAGGGAEIVVLERTVTSAHRWEPLEVDLAAWGGKEVSLSLSLAGDEGEIGFWGSPVVRNRLPDARAAKGRPGQAPRGVILVMGDTLRRDHLDTYGYGRPTAPVLTGMAKQGLLFEDCQTVATWTKAAAPSLMTSLSPLTHRVIEFDSLLPSSATTLAEVYRQAGYATVSLAANSFLGKFSNMHQGFEELHESTSITAPMPGKTARYYVDRLLPWIEAHKDTHFFAFLHLFDPHHPYHTFEPYNTVWAEPGSVGIQNQRRGQVVPLITDPLMQLVGMPSRAELLQAGIPPEDFAARDKSLYDGSIRAMDVEVGRLLAGLRSAGLDDDVVVAFVGDHGEEFLDHDWTNHGQSLYGELTNVPLLLWGPGALPAPARVPRTVQILDLAPTLARLSGLAVPESWQGADLLARGGPERPVFAVKAAITNVYGPPPRDQESFSVIQDGWKLIHHTRRPPSKPEFELFDHRRDPLDAHDVAAANPEVVTRLARLLTSWREAMAAAPLAPDAHAVGQMSDQELKRLRALGYVQ